MQEIKYIIENHSANIISTWLQSRCWKDPDYPAGLVSSIYYDTPTWRFLREKINSDFLKQKIRVRWYSDIESAIPDGKAFLEAKFKIGSRREKFRIPSDMDGRRLGNILLTSALLLKVLKPLLEKGVPVPGPVFPVFQINYRRLRFIEPVTGARINFDYDIHVPRVNYRMIPQSGLFHLNTAVFEFKGNTSVLPPVLHQLTALGCRKESFSKYMVCYQKAMGEA